MITEIKKITPEVAEELLSKNTANRSLSRTNLARLTQAIANGDWRLNGEAIKVAEDGTILDGQHRLMAVLKSGISIESLLVLNVPKEYQDTMDLGKSRNASDILAIRGIHRSKGVASLALRLIRFEQSGLFGSMTSGSTVTPGEITRYVDSRPDLSIRYQEAQVLKLSGSPLVATDLGVLRHYLTQVDAVDAAYFFDRLRDGVGLPFGDPILVLKNQMARALGANSADKVQRNHFLALHVKAWNKFRAGESITRLQFSSETENYPEAI